jgi:cytochrome c553
MNSTNFAKPFRLSRVSLFDTHGATTDMKRFFLPCSLLTILAAPTVAQEMAATSMAEPSAEQIEFFEKKIRPALVKHCYECHSTEGEKVKGGLLLDTREGSRLGGDSGAAVVPFKPKESLLLTAIHYEDGDLEMPPKYKLDDAVIADFEEWIAMGAPDPREKQTEGKMPQLYTNTIDLEKGREHWSYQKPKKPAVPVVADASWTRNAIDAFVAEGHAAKGVTPAQDADPRSLLRRLSFDLTGLPPAPEEVERFMTAYKENADSAIGETVARLLASEQYGERWGRHWLDVARYAESSGKEVNATYPHAWRYRDYVIDAFNADKPFDRFLVEQIAGDLLPAENDADRAAQLVATGFLALGTKSLNEQNSRQFRFDLVDEQIDTMTQAFLGTTAACARCHDHKFDPIPMADYYALAGIFLSSETLYGTPNGQQSRRATDLIDLPASAKSLPGLSLGELIDLEYQRDVLNQTAEDLQAEAAEARRNGDDDAQRFVGRILATRTQIGLVESKLLDYTKDGTPRLLAMGVRESGEPFDSQILIRGEEENATAGRVPRGFLQVVKTGDEKAIPAEESGRLQLAEWMASPENPLTARVLANRVWLWLFGEGLVSSVDNFGTTGEPPSHPELLDYLAVRLVALDWSVKDLIREITASRAYRMANAFDEADYEKDPENRSLWRARPRRLDAESLRDATLAVSGQLDLQRPDGSRVAEAGTGFVGRNLPESTFETESAHRSVYLPIVRGAVPESLALFDFSDPSLTSGKREITTVPSQALYLMNSPFLMSASEQFAKLLYADRGLRGADLAREAFYRAFSRPPTEAEAAEAKTFIEAFLATAKAQGMPDAEARLLALTSFCQSLLASAEFRYLN